MPQNILVGDIGSTKSSWRANFGPQREILLSGYNPIAQEHGTGLQLAEALAESLADAQPDEIWYYGAGIVDAQRAEHIRKMLGLHFPSCVINVFSDLRGACVAACENQPGTVSILGTGSHAAVFDGKEIIRSARSLGYILGDEGGGSDIGKTLIRHYFYGTMPHEIKSLMEEAIAGTREEFIARLYHGSSPNQYLASFARIAGQQQANPWIRDLLLDRFHAFMDLHLGPLSPEGPVHVVGSIGFIFAGLIRPELEKRGWHPGKFIQDPGQQLFELHTKHGRT